VRERHRQDVEAVARAAGEPVLQRIGDPGGGVADRAVGALADHALVELADGQLLALRQLVHHLQPAALGVGVIRFRHRTVERELRQVAAEVGRKLLHAEVRMDE